MCYSAAPSMLEFVNKWSISSTRGINGRANAVL